MKTNYVLVDFENVQPESLEALNRDPFKVVVFIGASQKSLPRSTVLSMHRLGDRGRYIEIAGNGKNALDFHIAYYLGKHAETDKDATFHIISKDTGFDPLVQHLKASGISCLRSNSIADIALAKAGPLKGPESSEDRARLFIGKIKQPKETRPRTLKTLSNHVASFFNKQLARAEVDAVVEAMQRAGYVVVNDGKVSYPGS